MDKLQARVRSTGQRSCKWERKWEREVGVVPPSPRLMEPVNSRFVIKRKYFDKFEVCKIPDLSPNLGWHMLYEVNKRLKADVKEMKAIIEEGVENWMERLND